MERVGRIGMRNTILDDWEITIVSVNGAPPDCFSDKMLAMVVDALENESDLICAANLSCIQWTGSKDEADRRYDERKEAVNG